MHRRIADYGIHIGQLPRGPRNAITDVPGVRVGHVTIDEGPYRTGVTVVLPGTDNPFHDKPVAAAHVLNGYGKTLGLVQVDELGTIETPIALTNTLNVGLVHDALVQWTLDRCAEAGRPATSINPVVCECNDSRLSDIAGRPVRQAHVLEALGAAGEDVAEGGVGAGRGMICHGLKGGIGTASRVVEMDGAAYTLGVLVLTNHGGMADLRIDGAPVGREIAARVQAMDDAPERGSVIVLMATDLPVDARQLRRILRRAPVGLARVGAYVGHGSGEVMLGFTTSCPVPHEAGPAVREVRVLREDLLDAAFRAVAESCEEAVLGSLIAAETTTGYRGDVVHALADIWPFEGPER